MNRIEIGRRDFLTAVGVAVGSVVLPRLSRAEDEPLPAAARAALSKSPLVYVSPLKKDGTESRCHGEVWYFTDGGDVVIATGKDAWKKRALDGGLDRARIWVGDYGPVKKAGDAFRKAPSFLAQASFDTDPAAFERLMTAYAERYSDGWQKWEPRFRKGYADGSRVVIRYAPVAS
ncbi:MAG: twin-arginine translocation signal domain-containing protein [Deltaproteobacteria bacterium]|nr:twin-arginine translocation signal domain-containing protein [Deltaproteobacteria bacterium]MBW2415771.1 twin-arginine translocation signal domain-containing protein [Deltaproteobacteria bacterium]